MGRQRVIDDGVVAEVILDMADERLPGIQIAAVDYHEFPGVHIAVSDHNSVARLAAVPDGEEFNFAIHMYHVSGALYGRSWPPAYREPLRVPLGPEYGSETSSHWRFRF